MKFQNLKNSSERMYVVNIYSANDRKKFDY